MGDTKCQPCQKQGRTLQASKWCVYCNELLCDPCVDYHKVLTYTQNHILIDTDDFKQAIDVLSKVFYLCQQHNKPIVNVCLVHNLSCCNLCKENDHYECETKSVLELLEERTPETEDDRVNRIDHMINLTNNVCKNRSDNMEKITKEHSKMSSIMRRQKDIIQRLMNEFENKIADVNNQYHEILIKLERERDTFQTFQEKLLKWRTACNTLNKLKAVPVYYFLVEKELTKFYEPYEIEIENEVEKLKDVHCDFMTSFKVIGEDISLAADLHIKTTQCHAFRIQHETETSSSTVEAEEDFACMSVPQPIVSHTTTPSSLFKATTPSISPVNQYEVDLSNMKSENLQSASTFPAIDSQNAFSKVGADTSDVASGCSKDIKSISNKQNLFDDKQTTSVKSNSNDCQKMLCFKRLKSFQVDKKCGTTAIKCVNVLTNGDIIIGEGSQSRLLIYTKHGCYICQLKVQRYPEAIAIVDMTTAAVTTGQEVAIIEVNLRKTMQQIRKVQMNETCYGITYSKNRLIVNCEKSGLKVMSLEGKILSSIPEANGVLEICASAEGTILCVKKNCPTIYAYDTKTLTVKKPPSSCQSMLGANGITLDNKNTTYVSCCYSKKIYSYSNEKSAWMVTLDQTCDIGTPSAICFDDKNNEFVVATNDGKCITIFSRKMN